MSITVAAQITPSFEQIGPLCQNSAAPILPTSSTDTPEITGVWSPATISTATAGTATYTFTPASGQCGRITTMTITTAPLVTPTFAQIGPLCQNSSTTALPLTSTNGITGVWSPATISTATAGTTTYTFTPATGQCATITSMNITTAPLVTPAFAPIGPLCQNSSTTALPLTSTNGITGVWSPATISTTTAGSTAYTFTPAAGQCAAATTLDITITAQITPIFAAIGPLCQNRAAPALPSSSTDSPAIAGTWNPGIISTTTAGTTTYTFTPAGGGCALAATMDIVVLPVTTSTTVVTVCSTMLPYSWNGQTLSTSGTYQAVLVGLNGCDSIATLNLTVNEAVTPVFTQIAPMLQGSAAPALADTSSNGVTGRWNPATISTTNAGTTTYTFTPDAGQCAIVATMIISVDIQAVIAETDSLPEPDGVQIGSCQQVNLDASKSIGNIVSYQWSLLDQGGSLTQLTGITTQFTLSPNYSGSLPSDFRVRLQITDCNGYTNSDTITFHIDFPPVANVAASGSLEKDGSMIVDGSVSKGTKLTFKWSTSEGRIIGSDDTPSAKFLGAGMYRLKITDIHGCTSTKDFQFPLKIYRIKANPDNYRITWAQDTTLYVLGNDSTSAPFTNVRVIQPANLGTTTVNTDLSITNTPIIRKPGHDQFAYEVCIVGDVCDSAMVNIDIYDSSLVIPEGFSPNNDGVNDILIFKGLENYKPAGLWIYTRSGQQVFTSKDYLNEWDGRMPNHQLVPTGIYYYVLKLGQTNRVIKGFLYIGY